MDDDERGIRELATSRIGPVYWSELFSMVADLEARRVAPSRLTHAAATLFGRDDELARLDGAWDDPGIHLITLVAWGGVGKTALVAKWVARRLACDGDFTYFDWSFYSQGTRDQSAASSVAFLAAALNFFSDTAFGDVEMATSPASPWDKGARLARLVAARRTLPIPQGESGLRSAHCRAARGPGAAPCARRTDFAGQWISG